MQYSSPLSMLYHWEAATPHKIYLQQPIQDVWHTWTWQQTGAEVRKLAAALKAMQFPPGSCIALLSKNNAHWIICDLAIMMAGYISVPLYPNSHGDAIRQILEHSEAKLLLAGKLDNWDAVKESIGEDLPCVALPFCNNNGCRSWSDFTGMHQPLQENVNRKENDICTIIYTSGTTGLPKGVMFTFESFNFVPQQAIPHLRFAHTDRFFSYLPLSHIAERMLVEMISLYVGGQVSFAESLQMFSKNLAETKPTVFPGVHRIWTKFQQGILAKMSQQKLDVLLKIPFVSFLVKQKIKKALGLNKASIVLTGAAPTPPSLIKWFKTIGIHIQEAYAMTENCCYSHVTLKEKIKIGFVGQPLPQCVVRLGAENEIQVKHKALMSGYYKDAEKTEEAFTEDGFLKTGDEGYIDSEGFLKITGRVKDLFKTAKGKYVAPSSIEMKLSENSYIEQVCIVGSGLPQPIALITLSAEGSKGEWNEVATGLKQTLQKINATLDAHEKVNKLVIMQNEWTVENNLLTPSFKIKRNEIDRKYAASYEDWYNQKDVVMRQNMTARQIQ